MPYESNRFGNSRHTMPWPAGWYICEVWALCILYNKRQSSGDSYCIERHPGQMAVTKEGIETTLTNKLQPTYLNVVDTSGGCGASFSVEIVSSQFDGKRSLDRHRMVNSALAEELKSIHALSLKKTLTPQQWNEQQAEGTPGATN